MKGGPKQKNRDIKIEMREEEDLYEQDEYRQKRRRHKNKRGKGKKEL